jgi:hypothetical protein
MIGGRLRRITAMSRAEWLWRAQTRGRMLGQSVAVRFRPPQWTPERLADILSPSVVDAGLRSAIEHQDWTSVQRQLAQQMRSRRSRFVLDPGSSIDIQAAVLSRWPGAAVDAAHRADRILAGQYDVLGYRGLSFTPNGSAVDWHFDPVHNRRAPQRIWSKVPYLDPAIGDHKVIWELNRHQHWLQLGRALWLTGDQRYAAGIMDLLGSWLAANPPLVGINWASMLEIGFRSISWTWAMHALLGFNHEEHEEYEEHERSSLKDRRDLRTLRDLRGSPWLVDMLVALDRQLTHVEQNLSYYFSPNTHLAGEALALYVVGSALPELASSARWADVGRRVLLQEIDRQILADGGHAERSMHYQRYMLDFYLLALMTARVCGDNEIEPRLRDAATRLAEFTLSVADEHGRLPLIGDDDGGMLWPVMGRECDDVRDSLAQAALVLSRPDLASWGLPEEVFWTTDRSTLDHVPAIEGCPPDRRHPRSRALADTGYLVIRDGHGSHAVLDAGVHGYMNGGHAHADALALTLRLGNRPLLVDPGTSTYTMDPRLRDRMRSTMNHNTVVINGRSQAIPAGPFHWRTRSDARLQAWRQNPAFDWVEASHDGYAPISHRRSVFRTSVAGWLVLDEILGGEGSQLATTYWHFDPAWMVTAEGSRLRARHLDGDQAWLLHDCGRVRLSHGDEDSGLGWYAPTYGTLVPTWTAFVTRPAVTPCGFMTWIGQASPRDGQAPAFERLGTPGASSAFALARLVTGDETSMFMLRTGDGIEGCDALDYQTDARVMHYQARAGRLCAVDIVDATHALSMRADGMTLTASETMPDLHLSIDQAGVLSMWASSPPAVLRLEGSVIATLRGIRLNGRELPVAAPRDVRLIHGGEWRSIAPRGPRADHETVTGAGFAALEAAR